MRVAILLPLLVVATSASAQRYLSGPGVAIEQVLPPAPVTGSGDDNADRATFCVTRAMEGSARWRQAIGDVDETIPAMLTDFTPAAGRERRIAGKSDQDILDKRLWTSVVLSTFFDADNQLAGCAFVSALRCSCQRL